MKGPKFVVLVGSLEDEIAAKVRPQKFPVTKIIFALFEGTPFTS